MAIIKQNKSIGSDKEKAMLTKGAIGNLVNRYRAVLKKCNLINTFGSLAVASMLVLGGAPMVAQAETYPYIKYGTAISEENWDYGLYNIDQDITLQYISLNHGADLVVGNKDGARCYNKRKCLKNGRFTSFFRKKRHIQGR